MDISGLSGSTYSAPLSTSASKKTIDSLGMAKVQNEGALVSGLLPSATSGATSGLGAGLDIYAAVGMQSQGLMSRGLLGVEISNISLGIDTSKAAVDAAAAAKDDSAAAGNAASPGSSTTGTAPAPSSTGANHTNTILNDILKADGVVPAEANPYQYTKDFFADKTAPAESAARIYSNPELSNPSLGGLLNSLG